MTDKESIMRNVICHVMYVITPCYLRLRQMQSDPTLFTVECCFTGISREEVVDRWCMSLSEIEMVCECFCILDDRSSIRSRDQWQLMLETAKSLQL